jgi:hypothetical protein
VRKAEERGVGAGEECGVAEGALPGYVFVGVKVNCVELYLFNDMQKRGNTKQYKSLLTAVENNKGVLDVDTVEGCSLGMAEYPDGGCYGECYANKIASRYGIDFGTSVSRKLRRTNKTPVLMAVEGHRASWYRIGTAGDPAHDWDNTIDVCNTLKYTHKTPVIITKHWKRLTNKQLQKFSTLGAVFNTSVSGLDTDKEIEYRVEQIERIRSFDMVSVCRVVTCNYGDSEWAKRCKEKQDYLLTIAPVIDNPLRASRKNAHVLNGDIILTERKEAVGGGKWVSLHNEDVYLETCFNCPDQCGAE